METTMYKHTLRPAMVLLLSMTLLLGVAFPDAAAGSLVFRDGKLVGSRLIGQSFTERRYFWGRPSATSPQPYNPLASTGSNLGPLNPALIDQVKSNAAALREADPGHRTQVPVELVTASASGLDPEISPAAAAWQAPRVAQARGLPLADVQALVARQVQGPQLGLYGEARVNVLALNLALDTLAPGSPPLDAGR